MDQEQMYYKISQVSKKLGLTEKTVRELCHRRGQRFAFRKSKRGNFLINIEAFKNYLRERCEA